MSHFYTWVSGFAAAACGLAAMRLYVPLSILLGFVSMFTGFMAWRERREEWRP